MAVSSLKSQVKSTSQVREHDRDVRTRSSNVVQNVSRMNRGTSKACHPSELRGFWAWAPDFRASNFCFYLPTSCQRNGTASSGGGLRPSACGWDGLVVHGMGCCGEGEGERGGRRAGGRRVLNPRPLLRRIDLTYSQFNGSKTRNVRTYASPPRTN